MAIRTTKCTPENRPVATHATQKDSKAGPSWRLLADGTYEKRSKNSYWRPVAAELVPREVKADLDEQVAQIHAELTKLCEAAIEGINPHDGGAELLAIEQFIEKEKARTKEGE